MGIHGAPRHVEARLQSSWLMDPLTISAAAGLRSRQEALDVLANNLANASTPGFKVDWTWNSLYQSADALESGGRPGFSAVVDVARVWTDFAQGPIRPSGRDQDLAIDGPGFFELQTPNGPRYTRAGSFSVSPSGQLIADSGDVVRVRPAGDTPFRLDPLIPYQVGSDGAIWQSGENKGTVELLRVAGAAEADALWKEGNNRWRLSEVAAAQGASMQPATGRLISGHLEAPNGGGTDVAVRLIGVMRQFEMLQKALGLAGEMSKRSVEELAKPS